MSWWNRATNIKESFNVGDNACDCHAPGRLHQVEFDVKGHHVRIAEDTKTHYFYVGIGKYGDPQRMSKDEVESYIDSYFLDKFDEDVSGHLPDF